VAIFAGITIEVIATTNPVFFVGKTLNGVAVGGFISLAFTYLGEIVPLALRGVATAAGPVAFNVGSFLVYLIMNYQGNQPNRWAYRGIFVGQYAITGIGAIFLPFLPE